jgi:hypothetical protein
MYLMANYRSLLLIIASFLAAALIALGYSGQLARAQDTVAGAQDQSAQDNGAGACDQTTQAAAKACDFNAQNDFWIAVGSCDNLADAGKKAACNKQAQSDLQSAKSDCQAQTAVRQQLCQGLGQAPYDPTIDPQNFVKNISGPLLPLKPGTVYIYDISGSPGGTDTFFITRDTIDILGVTCVVVRDTATIGGQVTEDTFDYFAQDKQGNVWYFGEDTTQLQDGVVVGVEGSWRAGVKGAKAGIVMKAKPKIGDEYRQEFALGTAEDMARVVALNQNVKVPFGSFSNALKTFEFTPLEPDLRENKYYVPGVGNVLKVDLVTSEREELIRIENR